MSPNAPGLHQTGKPRLKKPPVPGASQAPSCTAAILLRISASILLPACLAGRVSSPFQAPSLAATHGGFLTIFFRYPTLAPLRAAATSETLKAEIQRGESREAAFLGWLVAAWIQHSIGRFVRAGLRVKINSKGKRGSFAARRSVPLQSFGLRGRDPPSPSCTSFCGGTLEV